MSFAAMAVWQGLLVIAVAVAAAVGVFLLKLKPPQISVPSLGLWRRVIEEQREKSPWERIRKAVSLAVAVLITIALALAILRPQGTPARKAGRTDPEVRRNDRVSIVIDSSWSMLAETSTGRTRWDRAIARARSLAAGAAGEEIVLATTADGIVEGPTPDVALIEAALDRIAPSGGDGAAWPSVEGVRATYFLTDGAVARPLDAGVSVESVFEPAANVAITAFDVRPGLTLESAGQVFLEVANYAPTAQDVRISIVRGSAALLDVHVSLAPGTAVQRVVPLDRGGEPRLRARVSAKDNALVVDDEAIAWVAGAQPIAVTVVSDRPESYGPLLSQDPGIKATFVSPKNYTPGREQVLIFDRVLPAAPASVPALFVAPPTAPPAKTTSGVVSGETTPDVVFRLTTGVDMRSMTFDFPRRYSAKDLAPVATADDGTPLIYVHEEPDQRFVLFAFSVTDSKLMFAPGFPALMGNTLDWLARPVAGGTRKPGPATMAGAVQSVAGPDGKPAPVSRIDGVSLVSLNRVGFYTATSGGATSVIAVNAGDPEVSDLQRTRLPRAARADASTSSRGRPWWLYAGAAALLLLAAEWLTWQRRITV